MTQEIITVDSLHRLTSEILELTFVSKNISTTAEPGQFINIKVDNNYPLLRRPFSIFNIEGDRVSIVFNVIGTGTKMLACKQQGNTLDILGPCGNTFLQFSSGEYDTAVFVAGGIGIAPFPFLTKHFPPEKKVVTFVGGRNKEFVITKGLKNINIATDDGTAGFKGTVVDLIKDNFGKHDYKNVRFFTCGPTKMMKALTEYAVEIGAECYASLETDMACGIGLCQGCNIETKNSDKKYKLVCKEGTIFETKNISF